jgi:hypothetical protein
MICTVAAIAALLGSMPPKGSEIVVPRSALNHYSAVQQFKARLCARRYGIKWRIDETR